MARSVRSCAVAEYVDGKLTSWSASQQTHLLRKQMASMLNMKPDDVRCIYIEGAGCYGRNGHEDAAADAALIAKETGVPVARPVDARRRARLGSEGAADFARLSRRPRRQGAIVGWESEVWIPDRPRTSR